MYNKKLFIKKMYNKKLKVNDLTCFGFFISSMSHCTCASIEETKISMHIQITWISNNYK